MSLNHVVRRLNKQLYQEVLAHLRDVVCRKRRILGKPDLDVAPRQRADSRVIPHPQLSGKTSDIA